MKNFGRLGHRKIIFAEDEKCQKCAWHANSITSTFSISKGSLASVLFLDEKYFANKERQYLLSLLSERESFRFQKINLLFSYYEDTTNNASQWMPGRTMAHLCAYSAMP